MSRMRYWIVPNDGKMFNTEKAIAHNNGFVDWRAGRCKFFVGDIVFLYKSFPESCIRHMMRVVKTDINQQDAFNQKTFWTDYQSNFNRYLAFKYVRLELLNTIEDNSLNFANLRKHGLRSNLQGIQTCSGDLLYFILRHFE